MNPKHPIYIISKGRSDRPLTIRALTRIKVPFRVVVEPQEAEAYANVMLGDNKEEQFPLGADKLLVLPFSNLGQGSIPARNFVWEHSISEGAEKHWILDDNIKGFYRLHQNLKAPVADGTIFRFAEDFVARYTNVPKAGFNYFMFAPRKSGGVPPLYLNTRVYSCILLDNSIQHRWRGRYNEDTDLSLRVLKDGDCTILFNAFLADKMPTLSMNGGNTQDLYQDDGRLLMAESLQKQHPDCVFVTKRWERAQHYVDYGRFRNNHLKLKPGIEPDPSLAKLLYMEERRSGEWTRVELKVAD